MSSFDVGAPNADYVKIREGERAESLVLFPPENCPVDSWRYKFLKRALDVSLGSIILLVSAIPGLVIAAAIVLTSRGPVFFREERVGRYGRPFQIWKFRSMRKSAVPSLRLNTRSTEDGLLYRVSKNQHDPRITAVGAFLRRWSLDELPQIINVILGEMSLIGPRPIVEMETRFYSDLLPFYLAATPGMSGLWQVSGRCNIEYPKRAELDAAYVSQWSLYADLQILMQTLPAVLARTGAR